VSSIKRLRQYCVLLQLTTQLTSFRSPQTVVKVKVKVKHHQNQVRYRNHLSPGIIVTCISQILIISLWPFAQMDIRQTDAGKTAHHYEEQQSRLETCYNCTAIYTHLYTETETRTQSWQVGGRRRTVPYYWGTSWFWDWSLIGTLICRTHVSAVQIYSHHNWRTNHLHVKQSPVDSNGIDPPLSRGQLHSSPELNGAVPSPQLGIAEWSKGHPVTCCICGLVVLKLPG